MSLHTRGLPKLVLAFPLLLLAIAAPLARRAQRELEATRTEFQAEAAALRDKLDELALAAERLDEPEYLQFHTRNDLYVGAQVVVANSAGESRQGSMPRLVNSWAKTFGNPEQTLDAEVQSPGGLSKGENTVWVETQRGFVLGFNLPAATLLGSSEFWFIVSDCPNAWGVPRLVAGSIDDLGRFLALWRIWPKDFTPSPAPADRPECN